MFSSFFLFNGGIACAGFISDVSTSGSFIVAAVGIQKILSNEEFQIIGMDIALFNGKRLVRMM